MPIRLFTHYLTGCQIHYQAEIEGGVRIIHATGIVIGTGVKIGNGTNIFQHVTIGTKKLGGEDKPIIGRNVTIYTGAVIVGNIKIGDGCIIGANKVITKDILN
jgi:serine acetyltransferase